MSEAINLFLPGNAGIILTDYEKLGNLLYMGSPGEIAELLQIARELLKDDEYDLKNENLEEMPLANTLNKPKQFLENLSEAFKELKSTPFVVLEKTKK